jgi:hypothetical protein
MRIVDRQIAMYRDALDACERKRKQGCDVSADIKFFIRRLKELKNQRKVSFQLAHVQ